MNQKRLTTTQQFTKYLFKKQINVQINYNTQGSRYCGIGTTDTEVDLGIRTRQSTDTGTPKQNSWGPVIGSKRGKVRIPRPAEGPGIRTILSVLSVKVRIPGPCIWSGQPRYPY